MAFSYAGSIAQSRSEEINRSIMTFCRVELFVADDHSIVIHNLSLLTSARLPSPRSHILVRTSSVPAAKVEMGPFTDTSATVRNVTIPLGGIPHSAYAGFAPLPEGGVLLHAGVQLQLLLTNYPRCATDEQLILQVASSVGEATFPVHFRYSPLMEQICIRNFSLATSAYLFEWAWVLLFTRSMRVVILLVLSMVVIFLCFLFTGLRVPVASTLEGKLLALLLPEEPRAVYYGLNGSEGVTVVSEGARRSRVATVQGLSRDSGTKCVESDFAKVEKPASVKVEKPVEKVKAEKTVLEAVVEKNKRAKEVKIPEGLEELAQRVQREERKKKKERKEKRLAELKKAAEKTVEEKPVEKPVEEKAEEKKAEEKPVEEKKEEEAKEEKKVEVKPEEVKPEERKPDEKPVKEEKRAEEVKLEEKKPAEKRAVEMVEKPEEKKPEERKPEEKPEEKPEKKEEKPEKEEKVEVKPEKVEKKKREEKPEKKLEAKPVKEEKPAVKPEKKPEEKLEKKKVEAKPVKEEKEATPSMSPLTVTPSVVTVMQTAHATKPSAAPKAAPKAAPPTKAKAASRSSTPVAPVKPKAKRPASRSTSRNTSRSTSRTTTFTKTSTEPFTPHTADPSVGVMGQTARDAQGREDSLFREQGAFPREYGVFDAAPMMPERGWNNRGYGYGGFMNDGYYNGGFRDSIHYPLNYPASTMRREAAGYTPGSLLGGLGYDVPSDFDEYTAFSNYSGMVSTDTMGGLRSASGLNRPTGPVGPVGPNGASGPNGPSSPLGFNGPTGLNGPTDANGPNGPMDPNGPYGARDSRGYMPMGYDMYGDRSSAWLSVGAGLDDALNDSLYADQLLNYDRRNDQMMEEREDLPSNVRDLDAVVFPSSRSSSVTRAASRFSDGLSSGTPAFGRGIDVTHNA